MMSKQIIPGELYHEDKDDETDDGGDVAHNLHITDKYRKLCTYSVSHFHFFYPPFFPQIVSKYVVH